MNYYPKQLAFTLAELLIALGILGVIATFTIPKILDSGSDTNSNAIVKEAIAMITGAYQKLKADVGITPGTQFLALTPYLNYVKIQSDGLLTVDDVETLTFATCQSPYNCVILHSGAILYYHITTSLGDTSSTSALWFKIDPDAKYSSVTTGPSKAVGVWLYANGRLRTIGTLEPNTYSGGGGPYNPNSSYDPPWFSWSN